MIKRLIKKRLFLVLLLVTMPVIQSSEKDVVCTVFMVVQTFYAACFMCEQFADTAVEQVDQQQDTQSIRNIHRS